MAVCATLASAESGVGAAAVVSANELPVHVSAVRAATPDAFSTNVRRFIRWLSLPFDATTQGRSSSRQGFGRNRGAIPNKPETKGLCRPRAGAQDLLGKSDASVAPGRSLAAVKLLLVFTAALEAATGAALLAVPATLVTILLGGGLDSPTSVVVARVAGAALLSLGVACWWASGDFQSRAAHGVVAAMLLYDVIVFALLVHAGAGLGESGVLLWPAAGVHLVLAVASFAGLQTARRTWARP